MQDIVRVTPGQVTASPEAQEVALSPRLVHEATRRLCWVSLLAAITTIFAFVLQRILQPEVVPVQQDPVNSLALLATVLFAAGLIALQHYRVVPGLTILRLGMLFEIVVAFSIATLRVIFGRATARQSRPSAVTASSATRRSRRGATRGAT